MDLSECNGYNPPIMALAVWQLRIAELVGEEHGRRKTVAKTAKMSPSQFGDLINIPGKNPEIRQLQRIADALGVSLADLFRSPEATEGPLDDSRRAISASATVVLEHLGPAFRTAFVQLLMDILAGLGRQAESADEPVASTGTTATKNRAVSSGHR